MRVVCIAAGEGGVAFYRIIQNYSWIRDNLKKDIFIYDRNVHDVSRLYHEVSCGDIIIYQMPYSESVLQSVRTMKRMNKGKRKFVVAEYDDWIFGVSPWNPKYDVFGTSDVEVTYSNPKDIDALKKANENLKGFTYRENKDGSVTFDMWKSGYGNFDPEKNLLRHKAAQSIINEVDLVTTTTHQLAKQLRKYRPEGKIAVLPNLVDFNRFLPMKKIDDGKIRIGWQGGGAHFHDLTMVAPELIEFAKKHPEVLYVFQGVEYSAVFEEIKDRVTWKPWHSDIYTYPLSVRDLAIDIAICPLTNDPFNTGKSPIKYEEMSSMKVPCVCSPVVYGDYIEYGKDGYIANKGEWGNCLEELMDPKKRSLVGECAYNRVKKRFGIENAKIYWAALQDMVFNSDSYSNSDRNILKYKGIELPKMDKMELCLN